MIINKLNLLALILPLMIALSISSCNERQVDDKIKIGKQIKDSITRIQYDTAVNQGAVFPQIHAHLKGMVSEFVFQIFQDPKGNFWFCTNHDGIIKYDGKELIKYTLKSGLGGSAVRCIVMDHNGVLWFGTSGGLTKYDGTKFINYTIGEHANDNEIWSLAIDKMGTIWVGSNNGVSKFDGVKFTSFKVPKAELYSTEPMLSPERIGKILIDSYENKWFITDGYGITIYNDKSVKFLNTNTSLTDNNVTSAFEDSKGNIWIGTFNAGVTKFDGHSYFNFTKDGIIKGIEVSNFCEDKLGNVWFSAEGLGVYKYDGNKFKLFTTKDGLATNTIQSIYADNKGQIWCCTWQGISIFTGNFFVNVSDVEPWTK